MTRTGEIEKLCDKYGINKTELVCCILYFQFENKTFAHSETIGKSKKYKHADMAAMNFFNRSDIQNFMLNEKQNFFAGYKIYSDDENQPQTKEKKPIETQKDLLVPLSVTTELTKENIKQVLELELSKTTDPEKRTALLIRVADFLSLNSSDEVDFEKPIIYLPDRIPVNAL